jgi:energy-coupling factor transport system substrate-specific component
MSEKEQPQLFTDARSPLSDADQPFPSPEATPRRAARGVAYSSARDLARIGVMVALLSGGKLALRVIPQVEVVTLLILVYAATCGIRRTLIATTIFCTLEMLLYGVGTWVPLYYIYWNALGLAAALVFRVVYRKTAAKKGFSKWLDAVCAVGLAVVFTALFGVLSTAIDVLFVAFGGIRLEQMKALFAIIYLRGLWFYGVHLVSNTVIVAVCFKPLTLIAQKATL